MIARWPFKYKRAAARALGDGYASAGQKQQAEAEQERGEVSVGWETQT